MSAAYKCDFCGKLYPGTYPLLPRIDFPAAGGAPALKSVTVRSNVDDSGELVPFRHDVAGYEACPRCQQAILRALADAVEVEG